MVRVQADGADCAIPLCVIDEKLVVRGWSPRAAELTGIAEKDVLGRRCWEALDLRTVEGSPICSEGCPVAQRIFAGRSDTDRLVRFGHGDDQRPRAMISFGSLCRGEDMLVHAFVVTRLSELEARGQEERGAPRLTQRQLEVLRLLDHGLLTKQIAAELDISPNTVNNHIQAILKAFGATSRTSALHRARRLHLI